jgi:hypothetical protein
MQKLIAERGSREVEFTGETKKGGLIKYNSMPTIEEANLKKATRAKWVML